MAPTSRIFVTPRDLIGVEIDGRYRIQSIVGGGGMGVVFRTEQTNLGRDIALKLLRIDENKSDHRVERFLREIDIISQFTHPNIVRIHDSGRDKHLGLFYIAMELIEGLPLDRVLDQSVTSPAFALEVAYQTLAALTEPHAAGIIHRDIKPGNLLLKPMSDDSLQVKVVDFGIARAANPADEKITTTGVVVGTPAYMAPELAVAGDVDARSDLYSVGVLIYEMLSGQRPFTGDTPVAILLRHAVDAPPSLSTVVEEFPYPEIVELVDRLLSKDPGGRPASAKEARAEIDAIRRKYGFGPVTIDASSLPFVALAPYLKERPGGPRSDRATLQEAESDVLTDPYGATTTWSTLDETDVDTADSGGWLVSQDALERVPRFDPTTGELLSVGGPEATRADDGAGVGGGGDGGDGGDVGAVAEADTSENVPRVDDGLVLGEGAQETGGGNGARLLAIVAAAVVLVGLAVWGGATLLGSGATAVGEPVDAGRAPSAVAEGDSVRGTEPVMEGARVDAGTSLAAESGVDGEGDEAPIGAEDGVVGTDGAEGEGSEPATVGAKGAKAAKGAEGAKAAKAPAGRIKDEPVETRNGAGKTPEAGDSIPGLDWVKDK